MHVDFHITLNPSFLCDSYLKNGGLPFKPLIAPVSAVFTTDVKQISEGFEKNI